MPILYENLDLMTLFYNRESYNLIDAAGRELFSDWDIIQVEKSVFEAGPSEYYGYAREASRTKGLFDRLNRQMPFLKFGEHGVHHGYELFLSEVIDLIGHPTRGINMFMPYMARIFTDDVLPMDVDYLSRKFRSGAESLGIICGKDETFYFDRFGGSGMSSGLVSGKAAEGILQILIYRNRKYA